MWDFLSSIGRGIGRIGGGITSGVKKVPGLGPDSPGGGSPSPLPRPNPTFTTPSFNPAAKGGIEALSTDKINAPLVNRPSIGSATIDPVMPPSTAMPSAPLPRPETSAVGVPIPQLPGYKGEPQAYNPIEKARYDYVMKGAKRDEGGQLGGGFKRSGKDILMNSLMGGLQGSGDGRGLGGFIGGAAVGGLGSTISPQKGREYRFKNEQEPRLMEQQGRQDAAIKRERDIQGQGLDVIYRQKQIENIDSLNRDRDADRELKAQEFKLKYAPKTPAERNPREDFINTPNGLYQISTGKIIEGTAKPLAEKPQSLADLEAERVAEEGTPEQIANDSTQARQAEIMSGLPDRYQKILTGAEQPIDEQEQMAAQRAYETAFNRLLQQNLTYTRNEAKKKVAQRRTSTGAKPLPKSGGSNVAPRNVNDLLKYLR